MGCAVRQARLLPHFGAEADRMEMLVAGWGCPKTLFSPLVLSLTRPWAKQELGRWEKLTRAKIDGRAAESEEGKVPNLSVGVACQCLDKHRGLTESRR